MPIAFYWPSSKAVQCKPRAILPKSVDGYQPTKRLKKFDVNQVWRIKLLREHLFRVPHAKRRLDENFERERCV